MTAILTRDTQNSIREPSPEALSHAKDWKCEKWLKQNEYSLMILGN